VVSRKKKRSRFLIIFLVSIIIVIAGGAYITFWHPYTSHNEKPKVVIIQKKTNLKEISELLFQNDVIANQTTFIIAAEVLGLDSKIFPGTYTFKNGLSNLEVLNIISNSEQPSTVKITIREGLTLKQTAALLYNKYQMDSAKFLRLATDEAFIHETLKLKVNQLEGYLYPDTYIFQAKPEEEELVKMMANEIKRIFSDSLLDVIHMKKMNMHEILTMASIVEGEARKEEERPIIAGVYYNRLKRHMPLEADPTVQYSITDGPRRLYYKDYKTESPYNTYLHTGLPPGPVNNPGERSIMAAINPAKHPYIYFVADGTGGHVFTKTFSEHVNAKRRVRR
jgi:UPF0755 protein